MTETEFKKLLRFLIILNQINRRLLNFQNSHLLLNSSDENKNENEKLHGHRRDK